MSQPFASVGDVNGDGLADVLVGGETSALLYGKEDFGRDTAFRPHLPRGAKGDDLVLEDGTTLRQGGRLRYDIDLPGDTTLAAIQLQEEGLDGFFLPVGMAGDSVTVRNAPGVLVEITNLDSENPDSDYVGMSETLALQIGTKFDASWTLPDGHDIRESGDGSEAAIFREGDADPAVTLERVYRLDSYGSTERLLLAGDGTPLYHGDYFSDAPENLPPGYEILETDDYTIIGRSLGDGRMVQLVSLTEAWAVTELNTRRIITLEKTHRLEEGQILNFPLTLPDISLSRQEITALDFYDRDLLQIRTGGKLVRLFASTENPHPRANAEEGVYGVYYPGHIDYNHLVYVHDRSGSGRQSSTHRTTIGDGTPIHTYVVTSGAVELADGRILLPGDFISEADTLANGQAAMFENGMLTNQASTSVEVFVPLNRAEEELSVPHLSPQAGYRVIHTPPPPPPEDGEAEATGFGQIVAGLGDVNGDLVDDVAILALPPSEDDTATVFGVAGERGNNRVLLDLAEAPEDTFFQLELTGLPEGQRPAVEAAGDVNSDGYGDFLVTAPAAAGTGARVWLFYGNRTLFEGLSAADAELLVFGPESPSALDPAEAVGLGEQPLLGSAGDFNGDGYDDVFVRLTDPSATESPTRLAVLFGSDEGLGDLGDLVAGGVPLTPDTLPAGRGFFITHTSGEAVSFASDAASVGDVNGDGFSDFVVAASGQSFLLYGTESPAASVEVTQLRAGQGLVVSGLEAPSGGGASVAVRAAGDLNEDGFSDFWLGAPGSGSGSGSGSESYAVYGSVEYRSTGQRADFTPPEAR